MVTLVQIWNFLQGIAAVAWVVIALDILRRVNKLERKVDAKSSDVETFIKEAKKK